jgi:hypothetical protein
MRVNTRVFTERMDMLNGIQIPNCPSQFKIIAENIMNMATKPGYSVSDYNTMTELDKHLMVDYWREYDNLNNIMVISGFHDWFIRKATAPELIRRARQFLVERNYIIVKESIAQHAHIAGEKFGKSVKHSA